MKLVIRPQQAIEVRAEDGTNHPIILGNDRALIITIPDPEPGSSVLALSIRTEADETDVHAPHTSLAYREVYVAPKGGMTFRT